VQRALAALFRGAVGKDVVSRAWRRVKVDWEAWCRRDLAGEDVARLILDGTVVRVRLDRKATSISLLVVLGVRRDGQKVLLAARNMGGEGEAAWRAVLDDLVARGLRTPAFLIADGAAGLEKALAALWPAVPAQRCTVHKTGICWPTPRNGCTRRSRPTTRTWSTRPRRRRSRRAAAPSCASGG
jgi:putative transposase